MSSAVSLYSNPFTFGVCFPYECVGEDIRMILNHCKNTISLLVINLLLINFKSSAQI